MDNVLSVCWAFLIGGAFCVLAQLLIDLTRLTPARILVLYVSAGVVLGAVGLYEPLQRFAGCGASVPLVGFGGTIARGVREAVDREGLLGALTGGLRAAAGGTAAALCFGYLAAVCFRSKPKTL
ncbi:MAG: SpoVA/SpoVAEb family sporulation membrane protein [Eubacteriales bacterium]